jgi:hypothetical protein
MLTLKYNFKNNNLFVHHGIYKNFIRHLISQINYGKD